MDHASGQYLPKPSTVPNLQRNHLTGAGSSTTTTSSSSSVDRIREWNKQLAKQQEDEGDKQKPGHVLGYVQGIGFRPYKGVDTMYVYLLCSPQCTLARQAVTHKRLPGLPALPGLTGLRHTLTCSYFDSTGNLVKDF
jgi:hypothetical protein